MTESKANWTQHTAFRILLFVLTLFLFLTALKLVGTSFKTFGKDYAEEILQNGANPILGLFIGMLATAVIQSSSSTTSIIVTMVATGALSIQSAIPLILGANIGTSVTSSIVAFGHIGNRKEYRKAVATATSHDFFNIILVILLLPLELAFGILSQSAMAISGFLTGSNDGIELFNVLDYSVKPVAKLIYSCCDMFLPDWGITIISVGLLIISIIFFSKIFKQVVAEKAQEKANEIIFKNPYKALLWGTGLTALVQSSSVTTSLMVPVAASGKLRLKQVFPFLMGANIGTTVTALIAALSKNEAAITIALVHVLFNILGVLIFLPIKQLRGLPVELAKWLGNASYRNRFVGIAYVVITFFLLPIGLYLISR